MELMNHSNLSPLNLPCSETQKAGVPQTRLVLVAEHTKEALYAQSPLDAILMYAM
jgi:hypothetical protein